MAQSETRSRSMNWLWMALILVLGAFVFSTCISMPSLDGQPAPLFTATSLAGGERTLEAHLGSEVLVLNFWATWCPPCREELPALDALAKTLADQPVRFYAVNQGESENLARQFLESRNLDIEVLLDPDGAIGERYQVRALPTTYVIGRDGIIAHTHHGYGRGLEEEIRDQVLALLSK